MATFATNNVRQFYVVDTLGTVTNDSAAKTIEGKVIEGGVNKSLYFLYKGAETVLKSDLVPVKHIDYIKAFKAEDLRTPLKSQKITLDADVNGGNPVSGQDYILRIVLRQWYGMSDEDVYFKEGAVHAISGMTPEQFYTKMAESLNLCFAREVGANKDSNPYLDFKADATGITITEKPQPWTLGTETQEPVLFEAVPTTIYVDGGDVIWGKVEDNTPKKGTDGNYTPALVVTGDGINALGNGHKIADLEYFCMGERGDQYRLIGFPNYIPTKYLVDPDKEYNVLEIHFAYTGDGISSYRSEKDITIVSENADTINNIVAAVNNATGLTIKDLSNSTATTEG